MRCASAARYLVVAFVGSCTGPLLDAAPVRLNGSLVLGGDVTTEFEFSPDGSRVVYVANQNVVGVPELFSVSGAGGASVRISGAMVSGGKVATGYGGFTPSGSHRLYLADQDTDEMLELYAVAPTGGATQKINGPMISFGDVDPAYQINADGSRVLYIANAETNLEGQTIWELFNVPTAGGVPVKLNGPLTNGGDVVAGSGQFSPVGSRVFFIADQDTDEKFELYSVPSTGGTPVKINSTLMASGDVDARYQISSDGARAVYIATESADQFGSPLVEIFSVPSIGGTVTKLNGTLVNGGDVVANSNRISPSGNRVIYLADEQTNEMVELFSVPVAGGARTKLNGALIVDGDVSLLGLQFSPDGGRVLYGADQFADGMMELFSVPSTGGTAVRLNGPLVTSGDVDLASVAFSPDGSRVLYRADQDADEVFELFSVPSIGTV